MSSLEKLVKAFEALRVFQPEGAVLETKKKDQTVTKKEKIYNCTAIADCICSNNLRSSADFPKFLGVAVETFLAFCDDSESDVRIVADECLNRTIKTLVETNLGRLQVELYKEIKKNGSQRSLRAALWRFADMCHLIRPQKCRPYVTNLLPCLARICRRPEETIQDTLAQAMHKICPVLMGFTNDNEVKLLLKAFLPNLRSSLAVARRTAASSLSLICTYSRKATYFFSYLLSTLLDMVLPIEEDPEACTLLGVLLALRHLVPNMNTSSNKTTTQYARHKAAEANVQISARQMIQVFEVLLYYVDHKDHNVVTAALETLQQLLKTPPPRLRATLTTPRSIPESTIHGLARRHRTDSQARITSDADDLTLEDDLESGSEVGSQTTGVSSESGIVVTVGSTSDLSDLDPGVKGHVELNDLEEDETNTALLAQDDDIIEMRDSEGAYSSIDIGLVTDDKADNTEQADQEEEITQEQDRSRLRKGVSEDRIVSAEDLVAVEIDFNDVTQQSSAADVSVRDGDVGSLCDEVPLEHCVRVLCSKFLLTGHPQCMRGERQVRVSIKALSLGCLSAVAAICPEALLVQVHKSSPTPGDLQDVKDVLLYVNHSDPQLKGTVALLIGNLVNAALVKSGGRFDKWIKQRSQKDFLKLEDLMSILSSMLVDGSSQATRLALLALKVCLPGLLNTRDADQGLKLLLTLVRLKSNPYWLVKVELCDLLSQIDFKVISYLESLCQHHINESNHFHVGLLKLQDKILHGVLIHFLADDDARVRNAAAQALVTLVPRLFYAVDNPQQDAVISLAKQKSSQYLEPIMNEWSQPLQPLVHGLVAPFDCNPLTQISATVESSLSRVIASLSQQLSMSDSRHLTNGCVYALYLLTESYPTTLYQLAWGGCFTHIVSPNNRPSGIHSNQSNGLLTMLVSLLTSSPYALDPTTHHDLLRTAGNIFAGAAYKCLRGPDAPDSAAEETHWGALAHRHLAHVADQLLAHVARLLCICGHVLDDQTPGPPPTRTSLPSLPNAPSLISSPIKRKSKAKDEPPASPQADKQANKDTGKDSEKEKGKKEAVGAFYSLPHYLKIYEVLKSVNASYKISLDLNAAEKFGVLLRAALHVFTQMLEMASIHEVGKHAEELLGYLKSAMSREATSTVNCVQQLLKALFGTNLAAQWESGEEARVGSRLRLNVRPGLYHCCFTAPYTQFTQCLAQATFRAHGEQDENSWLCRLKKRAQRKVPTVLKSSSPTDKTTIANYIRLFEPLVIKSLKQYTMTSDVELQKQVLNLLIQLVHLRVNYCLLDADQIFIGFVIKQFEYIEEGQIRASGTLVPHVFNFLVLLSYERYHSKAIIGFPKIIQLCDGIMASGQDPANHAIPALEALVQDLFVVRASNKPTDANKDIDTQREVVISMLLKLIHHYQILELFILVLHHSRKESEEKWKRLSRQVTDTVLPLLSRQQLSVDKQVACDVVHRLFEVVAPSVFRPVDILLKTLFSPPHDLSSVAGMSRWLALVLVLLRVLISQSKEDTVLSRLKELSLTVYLYKDLSLRHKSGRYEDSMLDMGLSRQGLPAEQIFARFLFQVVGLVAMEIEQQCTQLPSSTRSGDFLCQELSHLLLSMMHMFQSGMFRKVAGTCMQMLHQPAPEGFFTIQELNALFKAITHCEPTLALQWCNILILLNYDDQAFWSDVMLTNKRYLVARPSAGDSVDVLLAKTRSCHEEITRRGALVLYSDFVCENLNDAEKMTWVIINHVNDLMLLSTEPPVQDFIGALHRNSAASGLLLQAINSRCEHISKPSLVRQMLACLDGIHQSQSGALVVLLLEKFLHTHQLTTARQCDMLACRRLEFLLAEQPQNARQQLVVEDLNKVLSDLSAHRLQKRHERLLTLLTKLRASLYPRAEAKHDGSAQDMPSVCESKRTADKEMFELFTKRQCREHDYNARECAQLLQHLDYASMLNIIMHQHFKLAVLADCLRLGLRRTMDALQHKSNTVPRPPALVSSDNSPSDNSPSKQRPLDDMYKATQVALLRHINSVINTLPMPHRMMSLHALTNHAEEEYHEKMFDLFSEVTWLETVFPLADVLLEYLWSLRVLPWKPELPSDSVKDVTRFAVVCLEVVYWMLLQNQFPAIQQLQTTLGLLVAVLQNTATRAVIGEKCHVTLVCTAIRTIHQILCSLVLLPGEKLVRLPHQDSTDEQPSPHFDDMQHAVRACDQISELVQCLRTHLGLQRTTHQLPAFLARPLSNCIIGLARLPVVNSYARTPPIVWKMGWMPSPSGDLNTQLPPLPLEYLQEKEVLKESIFRVHTIGWTSRQQFEETWMGLLGVLNPVTSDNSQSVSVEEDIDRTQCVVLATRGITALLVQSLLTPVSGDPSSSVLQYLARDKAINLQETRVGRKLALVRGIIQSQLESLMWKRRDEIGQTNCQTKCWEAEPSKYLMVTGMEREYAESKFGLAQLSVASLWGVLGMLDSTADDSETDDSPDSQQDTPLRILPNTRQSSGSVELGHRPSVQGGLDLHSCLQFLLDLYGQLLSAHPKTPLMQLNETIRSVVCLSDVFTEKPQYEWMLATLLEVYRVHPAEDELAIQYIVVGVCKAASVTGLDAAQCEKVVKLVETHLRSTHLPTKMATVYGTLYLLEASMEEVTQQILPHVTEYLLRTLTSITTTTIHSQHHVMLMWSCAFYICEHYVPQIKDGDFLSKVIQTAIVCVSTREGVTSLPIYVEVMTALERLVLGDVITTAAVDTIVKLAVDRLACSCPHRSLSALGLLLTCMYSGKQSDQYTPTAMYDHPEAVTSEQVHSQDPESLIRAMERVNCMFDRMRRGSPYEAQVMSSILPHFLLDFFPPQDIMNKIIGEFLSSQQPHPCLMAHVIFQVFGSLLQRNEHALVQEWVMLSLSNFTQRTPISMATWSLTCFFICASTNQWLRAFFSHIVKRMGRLDPFDQQLLLLSAQDFASQITDPTTAHTFRSTFQSVAHLNPIYSRLLALCDVAHS